MGTEVDQSTMMPAGRRRDSRLRVQLPARLITYDGHLQGTLINLSFRGAKVLIFGQVPQRGTKGLLGWDQFEALCRVAWAEDSYVGLDFDGPLPPHVVLDTRALADLSPRIDASRKAASDWASGRISRL
jgi:hypothetical protein